MERTGYLLIVMASLGLGCSIRNARIQAGAPSINSYKSFDNAVFPAASEPFRFHEAADKKVLGSRVLVTGSLFNSNLVSLETFISHRNTISFSIIRNDSILYEYYDKGYDENSVVTSFSVAKSYVSLVLGIAIHEGFIGSVEDPVYRYVDIDSIEFCNLKIKHLLKHTSGVKFPGPGYLYYTPNLNSIIPRMRYEYEPGTRFSYDNANTQLLSIMIEKATGRSFQEYFREKLWNKMQPEHELSWSMDSRKHQVLKTFCCMNGTSRDLGRIGKLMLQGGRWNGEQVVPEAWIRESTKIDSADASPWECEYFWWLGPKEYGYYFAAGLYGQYVFVYPKKNLVITRFARRGMHMHLLWKDQIMELMDQL